MKEVMVKAVPVNGLAAFAQKELSAEQFAGVLAQFPEEQRKFFSAHVLASDQIPLSAVNRFTTLAAKARGEPVKTFARRAGRYGAELGIKSVYKFIMMVMSTESVLKKAPFMWSRVYDSGVMTVDTGDRTATIRIREFPGDEAGCGRITGWFEVIGENSGAKDIRTSHSMCTAEKGTECVWIFSWKN